MKHSDRTHMSSVVLLLVTCSSIHCEKRSTHTFKNVEQMHLHYLPILHFRRHRCKIHCPIPVQVILWSTCLQDNHAKNQKFPLQEKNQTIHKRASVTLLRVCRVIFLLGSPCPRHPSHFRKSEKFWTGSFMIPIQLLHCLSKVPDQFFLFLLRKQCNGTIASSPKLTIVGHPALGNWLTLCKHFITTLLLVCISQNAAYYSLQL